MSLVLDSASDTILNTHLTYLINHFFLPPKLPQEDDSSPDRTHALLRHISDSAAAFLSYQEAENAENGVLSAWRTLCKMLQSTEILHKSAHIPLECLRSAINDMEIHDILALHICKQNAGLILRKTSRSHLTLEFFQASPTAAAVASTVGKLIVQFPSRPRLLFPTDSSAIDSLCALLVDLDCTEMPDAAPVTRKAGSVQIEVREVADIRYISELLGGIARACTEDVTSVAERTTFITKRIDDHVLWKSALLPWRRAPSWMIIRVVLQTTLEEWEMDPRYGYKVFTTFVLARLLERASSVNVAHDILSTMNAKIAIRVSKLPPVAGSSPVVQYIAQQIKACGAIIRRRWTEIQAAEALPLDWKAPTMEEIEKAKGFCLTNSRMYLSEVYNRSNTLSKASDRFSPSAFEASLLSSSTTSSTGKSPPAPIPLASSGVDLWVAVLDLERWVACDMPLWLSNTSFSDRVEPLRQMIERHHILTASFQESNPELFSRAFLTQMELWVALDGTVVNIIPLLAQYSPELDVKLCEPLLLPTLDQMIRAQAVEEYLYDRRACAIYSNHSIFKFDKHRNAFPARYFDKNSALQSLRSEIIEEATLWRSFARQQCQTLNDEYKQLTSKASGVKHTYIETLDRWGDYRLEHSHSCNKCKLEQEVQNLRIRVHEWPLPEDEVLSRLVVFELRVPNAFGVWRDTTFSLARQYSSAVLKTNPSPVPVLRNYPALSAHFDATTSQQLTIASTAKSFLASHYEWKNLPCDEDDIVKKHALRYDLFDGSSRCWINPSVFLSMSIRTQCTPSLPPGPYNQLDWSIVGTKHTPNMVIAYQSQCPSVISYHEWDSFGHLRAGNRLQWRNMMLELVRGTLTLGNPATYLLFRQAAWQAEKALSYRKDEDPRREAHLDLAELKFGQEVLTVLRARFANISANWQEGWTAATLSMIACRLFSLSMDERVKEDVRQFLACLRQTLSGWMEQVLRLKKSKDAEHTIEAMNEFRDIIIQLSVTCRSTYMLDGEIAKILCDSNALTLFIDSAIVLQNIVPANLSSLSSPLRYMVEKDVVLSAEVFDVLKTAIYSHNLGLDNAIRRNTWQAFQRNPRVPWHPIGNRWMTCQTSSEGNAQVCYVYLNLYDGTFLVDGKTIAGLPKEILRHSLFQALFQNQSTADIVPSTMKGMDYQLSTNIRSQEVHFALRSQDLLVRTRGPQGVSEFVPNEKLQGDVPNVLLHQTCLVFHNTSQTLEIYPTRLGWDPSTSPTWRMYFNVDPIFSGVRGPRLVNTKSPGDIALSPDSDVVKSIHAVLLPMETSPANLLAVSTSSVCHGHLTSDQNVRVKLPRYKLNFFVNVKGDLECKDLPGFSVSDVQSIGTLCGLKSKLVLKTTDGQGMRRIIVPDGTIEVSQEPFRPHHQVTITPPSDPGHHIRVFMYDVDDLIGRLVGDGTLTSWYILIYLHILTSYLLSDPLIHRTGVQQALQMLCSANSFSFMELTDEHKAILTNIINLTPTRQYYPMYLTSMEMVTWHPILSPYSQIAPYTPLVEAILGHGNNQEMFRTGGPVQPLQVIEKGSAALRQRAEFRNARFVSSEPQELGGKPADDRYVPSRCLDVSSSADKEQDVVEMANLAHQWPTGKLKVAKDLWHHFKEWRSFSNPLDPDVDFNSARTWLLEHPSYVWFVLLSLCRRASRRKDAYGITFTFGILAYRRDFDPELCHSLLAVATHNSHASFKAAALLPNGGFDLGPGHTLKLQEVERLTEKHRIKFNGSHQLHLTLRLGESRRALASRRRLAHESTCDTQCQSLAKTLFSSWPYPSPHMPTTLSSYSLINTSEHFRSECEELFSSRFDNYRFFQCTTELQIQLNSVFGMTSNTYIPPPLPTSSHHEPLHSLYSPLTLRVLMEDIDRVPDVPSSIRGYAAAAKAGHSRERADASATRNLLARAQKSPSNPFTARYTDDLLRCVSAFERPSSIVYNAGTSLQLPFTDSSLQPVLDTIIAALKPNNLFETLLSEAGLWPSTGLESLLGQLSFHCRKDLPKAWCSALTSLAESVAAKQQALRLTKFTHLGLNDEFYQEAENHGGQGWDMMAYPDWLLIQLDANLLIRPVQASVAQEMMAPKSQANTVMQLNMGDGKSSVIVPIISAALADGEQLVRVLVLKPLCAQMFNLLKQRICRLSNRRLFYLPFSRDMKLDVDKIRTIIDLFKDCARVGGVLVCQPEHILSFQLMGLHTLCRDGDTDESRLLLDGQDWLNKESRDILDESDEILSVRYQLIYTVGTPKALRGQPDRWETVQEVFSLLKESLTNLATHYPKGLEMETTSSDRFPRTRILSQECGLDFMQTLARQIVYEERMKTVSFRSYPNNLRTIAFQFLTSTTVSTEASHALNMHSGDYFDQLLLLRGLVAHGILLHSLKEKRWRVDYGLDPSRSMLAVPYRAKDSPASRAEFGHPDMILVLTCLSYYYGGLTDDQMDTTFQRLYTTDNPDLRYEDWIKRSSNEIPETQRNLRGLNLDDAEQKFGCIFPLLRFNKSVIDFYLSECVFPKEVKEFEHKLTTNAWDLARKKTRLTTGFSGTNDHSYLLPLSIHQLDAEAQRHTNAQVLEYLLRPENRHVINTGSSTAINLIRRVVAEEQHVMVLLDVGAQVLELENEDVAREWLRLETESRSHVEAAIYCSPDDEFYVVTSDGRIEPLATSVYNSQLDMALVYLDEAHTRGTDFKFPKGTRAVVTLGPKTTKDKLVQGCMRMRKLGSDHSISFFASGEVWGKIEMCIGTHKDTLDSNDVLLWAMQETCTQITDNGALWASQGENFDRRRAAWEKYAKGSLTQLDLANVLREPESRTLEELYGVRVEQDLKGDGPLSECQEGIRKKCREYGIRPGRSSALLEEQERELAHEKEEERQVERVVDAKPLQHSLDPALKTLVQTGRHSRSLKSVSLLQCLQQTTRYLSLTAVSEDFFRSEHLVATGDFSRTVTLSSGDHMDDFLRAVQWVLTTTTSPNVLLLLSPFEANELLPEIRLSRYANLHMYSPRTSRTVRSLDGLDLFAVSQQPGFTFSHRRVIHELNLFSGQLFFNDRVSFEEVCDMLGLYLGEMRDELQGKCDAVGFVHDEDARQILGIHNCPFAKNPLAVLRELVGWRRKGQGYTLTHVGAMLHGNNLSSDEFVA